MHSSAAYQTSSDRTVFPTDRTLPALLRNDMTGVLTISFGNSPPVEGWSEALGEAYVRSWPNFSSAADEANLARIWAGIHWRTAVVDARAAGDAIGAYVMANAAQPVDGKHGEHDVKHGKHKGHH